MALEQRITALERRVQLHRRLIVAVILVAALLLMLAASQDPKVNDVVQTKRLEVFNQAGRRVFVAEADSTSGHGRAAVLNASGGPVIVATGEETGGIIMFFDNDKKLHLSISADEGGGFLQILDGEGKSAWSAP